MAVSVSLAAVAPASTRPHYGGTLRLSIRETPASLDPGDSSPAGINALPSLSRLLFDTLVTLDARGQAQPALSTSWQAAPGNQRWQFSIRRGVTFQDGTPLSADAVAASLRVVNPNWKVFAIAEAVVVECDAPTPNLPAILALARYAIARRGGGKLAGTGPFAINRWDPGKKLTLTARDEYWDGRAFVDSIEIEMGKNFHDQMIALDLGSADIVEVAPDQARHAALEGRRVESSAPSEWMALVFTHDSESVDGKFREALALSIDRTAINNVLLQGGGEPAGSFLPEWQTGYAFLFPTAVDLQRARQIRGDAKVGPTRTLAFDDSDPLSKVIAARVRLNALDAGLVLLEPPSTPTNPKVPDIRLVRLALPSLDARVALSELAAGLGLPSPRFDGDPAYSLYAAENALLQSQRLIPLLHLRTATALGPRLMGWQEDPDGSWGLPNVWLGTEKP